MECPTDRSALVMSERSGIEIDYCPQCRGVWLDRGELDKIIERGAQMATPQQVTPPRDDQRYDQSFGHTYDARGYPRKKKREHWLSELFD